MPAQAIYARVSTLDQDCSIQLATLKAEMEIRGWGGYAVYMEKLSGKEGSKRPELARLLRDAGKGKFDTVMVAKLDRFGRSTLDTLVNMKHLDDHGVRFLCPSLMIDTDNKNPMAKAMIGFIAIIAELERDFILERTVGGYKSYQDDFEKGKVGLTRHSKSGKDLAVGRPRKVFKRGRIQEMITDGHSQREVARMLKIPRSTVRDALKRCPAMKSV